MTMTKKCQKAAAFYRIVKHVEEHQHCGRKWAGMRTDQPYCDEYLRLSREHEETTCTCRQTTT